MRWREFISLLDGASVARSRAALAQQARKVCRVGVIFTTIPVLELARRTLVQHAFEAFVDWVPSAMWKRQNRPGSPVGRGDGSSDLVTSLPSCSTSRLT